MHDRRDLAQWLALLGQSFLQADVRRINAPEDFAPEAFRPLIAELDRACAAPLDAEVEYTRLFVSASGAPCPPWQSVWSAADGEPPRLMGAPHHLALEWFRAYGFEPANESEPADHLGLLLLFYARLMASGADPETLNQFHANHLDWAPRLLERLAQETRHPFYKELAAVALRVIQGSA